MPATALGQHHFASGLGCGQGQVRVMVPNCLELLGPEQGQAPNRDRSESGALTGAHAGPNA